MKPDPKIDPRRADALFEELLSRANAWVPAWRLGGGGTDAGRALLRVAARLGAEVTERLDRVPSKLAMGLLDWLGVGRQAGHAARLPVVFKMTKRVTDAPLVTAPARIQASVGDQSVVFETLQDVQLSASPIIQLVAVDAAQDAFYLPPDDILSLDPPPAGPSAWMLKSPVAQGGKNIQLNPPTGLLAGDLILVGEKYYQISSDLQGDLASLVDGLEEDATGEVKALRHFTPFDDGFWRSNQKHHLYIGDENVLSLTAPAYISLDGGAVFLDDVRWQYWGKPKDGDPDWFDLTRLHTTQNILVLKKDDSRSVEMLAVNGITSRWIRAERKAGLGSSIDFNKIEIRVNCVQDLPAGVGAALSNCCSPGSNKSEKPVDPDKQPKLEGVSNTTALVLNDRFYPFGKTPRQFDSFYLACPEVFSKAGASACIDLTIADPTVGPLVVIKMGNDAYRLLGVARDGALHSYILRTVPKMRLERCGPLRPSANSASGQPVFSGANYGIDPALILDEQYFSVIVWPDKEDKQIWKYSQKINESAPNGRWEYLGNIVNQAGATKIKQIVAIEKTGLLALLENNELWYCPQDNLSWKLLDAGYGKNFNSFVPVLNENGSTQENICVAIDDDAAKIIVFASGKLVRTFDVNGQFDKAITPTALYTKKTLLITGKSRGKNALLCCVALFSNDNFDAIISQKQRNSKELSVEIIGRKFGWRVINDTKSASDVHINFVILVKQANAEAVLGWWKLSFSLDSSELSNEPVVLDEPPLVFEGELNSIYGPVLAGNYLLVSGGKQNIFGIDFKPPTELLVQPSNVSNALVIKNNEIKSIGFIESSSVIGKISKNYTVNGLIICLSNIKSNTNEVTIYPEPTTENTGKFDKKEMIYNNGKLTLKVKIKVEIKKDNILIISTGNEYHKYTVVDNERNIDTISVVVNTTNKSDFENVNECYFYSTSNDGDNSNLPSVETLNNKIRGVLIFNKSTPIRSGQILYAQDSSDSPVVNDVFDINNNESIALLGVNWGNAGHKEQTILISSSTQQDNWLTLTRVIYNNPDLSWEYWNGTGWWKIKDFIDKTADLKVTGCLEFPVPDDLAPTDVLGRQSHWIRARLVGGDYGREIYVTETKPKTGDTSTQTQSVEVNTDNIRAPVVLGIGISYSICTSTLPAHVLTFDNGSWREQSDANRADGAQVEVFVPIAEKFRMMETALVSGETTPPCSAAATSALGVSCSCQLSSATPANSSPVSSAPAATSRALYLAFASPLQGGPIRILFLLEDRDLESAAPLAVEVLRNNRFESVLVQDATRGLGETGLLSITLDSSPTEAELFGITGFWLRLKPSGLAGQAVNWQPHIKGVYVNAAWAEAAETQELEILGSSDGSPGQTFTLARPPVLEGSLDLRVLEPLGEEEVDTLETTTGKVRDNVPGLPGSWVRWNPVVDPGDHGPDARVYALDSVSGEISFGDGEHGSIPPAGHNAVVAFRYCRGGTAAANAVASFALLNLVSPIQGVEAAIAPGPAAGGADPEDPDTVRRFAASHLRHRNRAVTLKDFEDLALHSSPDIVQARALAGSPGARLLVVVRGSNPDPSQFQIRALRQYLLDRASPALARTGALVISPVERVLFRLNLQLTVDSLDVMGAVAKTIAQTMQGLFDAASGGHDGLGWQIGTSPGPDAVAACLVLITGIAGIDKISFTVDGAAVETDSISIRADQLAWLMPDGTRITFRTAGSAQP